MAHSIENTRTHRYIFAIFIWPFPNSNRVLLFLTFSHLPFLSFFLKHQHKTQKKQISGPAATSDLGFYYLSAKEMFVIEDSIPASMAGVNPLNKSGTCLNTTVSLVWETKHGNKNWGVHWMLGNGKKAFKQEAEQERRDRERKWQEKKWNRRKKWKQLLYIEGEVWRGKG